MISCTEFIPSYSELFTFLEDHYGKAEVERFWTYLFEPTGDGIPLINFAKKDGIKGCWDYWCGTLTEEASDTTMIMNEKAGWFYSEMHYCPSKGRLLELEKELGIKPYHDYCGHCDYYRASLEKVGLTWIRNHMDVDGARCRRVLYDPKVFKGVMKMDENTVVREFKSEGAEYFHRDFHSSLNMGIDYVATRHGEDMLKEYLTMFTRDVYSPVIKAMKEDPLGAIEKKIRETYRLEKAEDALEIARTDDSLSVKIACCPAVKHLRATGRKVSDWFHLSTETVMDTLAKDGGLQFEMKSYDKETGAAEYCFTK